ncbi:unnamed protein product [Brachionus calyciflorus]|uniref:Uncharacterized protein n=1 Tax=Brachionus calyciflorus TaxID=104777 RepID=A0A814SJ33_9BILA|nr:unnamed protein product [Brachionus calyciflorus]
MVYLGKVRNKYHYENQMFLHRTPGVHIEQYRNVVHGDEATFFRNAYQYPFIRDGLNRRHFVVNMEVQATTIHHYIKYTLMATLYKVITLCFPFLKKNYAASRLYQCSTHEPADRILLCLNSDERNTEDCWNYFLPK